MGRWVGGQVGEWVSGGLNKWVGRLGVGGWIGGRWVGKWVGRWLNGWVSGWMCWGWVVDGLKVGGGLGNLEQKMSLPILTHLVPPTFFSPIPPPSPFPPRSVFGLNTGAYSPSGAEASRT